MFKLILLVCTLLMMLSCSKPGTPNPIGLSITGKWKAVLIANDDNGNKKLDAGELRAFTPKEGLYLTFNSDGTGSRNSSDTGSGPVYDTTYTMTYTVANNYVDMRFNTNDEIKQYIQKLNTIADSLTLRSEDNIWSWTVYKRQ